MEAFEHKVEFWLLHKPFVLLNFAMKKQKINKK